jgi:ATP-binding cassette subfamily B protein RaxB
MAAGLSFAFKRRVPVVLQGTTTECGLACLAMIAAWHGYRTDIAALRRRFDVSLKGSTLKQLIDIAAQLSFTSRAIRLELDELADLRCPCVLHWDMNHFVVLVKATRGEVHIIDPATGERRLPLSAASAHFTGVALELEPDPEFRPAEHRMKLPLSALWGGNRGIRTTAAQLLMLALALEVVVLASPLFMQWVVDGAILSADRDLLLLLASGFGFLLLIQAAVASARSWVILYASTHLSLRGGAGVFAHLFKLPVTWFERRHVGDVVSRFESVAALQRTLTTSFLESFVDGLMAAAALALMLAYSPELSAIAIACAALYALLRWAAFGPLRSATEEQLVLAARANSVFIETVRAVTPIKLFNHEHTRQARWVNATVEATNRGISTERITLLYKSAQGVLSGIEHVIIVYLGAIAVMEGSFSVGMLLAFVAYRTTFSSRIAALTDKCVQLKMLALHRERLADILLAAPEELAGASRGLQPRGSALEAVNVSFRYSDSEPWVLRNVDVRIEPGECVAVTGGSGCGKTTLLKILMGLLPPTEGEIRFGGIPIPALGARQYRDRIAAVLQDDQLLAGSIAENIAFFDPLSDRTRIEACSRIAAIDDEIAAMPMGYETLVGDMGSSLSGGQKQRILLARALYKRPQVLFLDEATSHLDLRREDLISQSVGSLNFTRVIVAHRPHTIAGAQRVIVLANGTIKQDLRVSTAFAQSYPRPQR